VSCLPLSLIQKKCRECVEEGEASPICTALCLNVALLLIKADYVEATEEWVREVLGVEPVGLAEVAGGLYGKRVRRIHLLARAAAYICDKLSQA
jgi:hypothetical protein